MKIELPQVGESVAEGIIGKWLKQVGDQVEKYDPLVEVVTDKVSMEMPSPVSGVLSRILAEEGQTVPMGGVIADIEVDGEEAAAEQQPPATASAGAGASEVVDRTGTLLKGVAPVGPTASGGPIVAATESDPTQAKARFSPAVMRLASEHGVDVSLLSGTGIGGRVTRKDVQAYIDTGKVPIAKEVPEAPDATAGAAEDIERVPLTAVRRMIAANMVKSATQIPEAWTLMEADVTNLVLLRNRIKDDFQSREGVNITYLAFVVKAVAESLRENRLVNSMWGGDAVLLNRRINVGVAVAAPEGLVVPVVHDADTMDVPPLTKSINDLATRARNGKLALADVQGGTFTVNNTGALGSVVGKGLINYPQAAILNTEAIVKRPVVLNDAIAIRSIMNLCLTFDHRILDGAEAGAFVGDVKRRLEAIQPDMEM